MDNVDLEKHCLLLHNPGFSRWRNNSVHISREIHERFQIIVIIVFFINISLLYSIVYMF